jgi:divalent metal cation (Fe/Co/Zn/Cd) transporter
MGLLETAPRGISEQIIEAVRLLKGINDCHAVRIRPSGARWFVDLHVTMDGSITLAESHRVTERIETKVQTILPGADVTVHVEPLEMAES